MLPTTPWCKLINQANAENVNPICGLIVSHNPSNCSLSPCRNIRYARDLIMISYIQREHFGFGYWLGVRTGTKTQPRLPRRPSKYRKQETDL